jgi:hypothetical protein
VRDGESMIKPFDIGYYAVGIAILIAFVSLETALSGDVLRAIYTILISMFMILIVIAAK